MLEPHPQSFCFNFVFEIGSHLSPSPKVYSCDFPMSASCVAGIMEGPPLPGLSGLFIYNFFNMGIGISGPDFYAPRFLF
jgi:hypothetical protein